MRIHLIRVLLSSPQELNHHWALQVMGKDNVVGLLKRLRPKVFLPLVNAEFDSEGPLSSLISEKGNVAGLPDILKAEGLKDIELVVPDAGKATSVSC